jgi:hypothetical protein
VDNELTRREFLEISAAAGLAALNARPSAELTSEERRTLLAVVRTLFPHDHIGDGPYLRVVDAIQKRCHGDAAAFKAVTGGTAALESASGARFATANDRTRTELLKLERDSLFFRVVYREALQGLYGSRDSWSLFTPRQGDRPLRERSPKSRVPQQR